jgi:hypothetical protein
LPETLFAIHSARVVFAGIAETYPEAIIKRRHADVTGEVEESAGTDYAKVASSSFNPHRRITADTLPGFTRVLHDGDSDRSIESAEQEIARENLM